MTPLLLVLAVLLGFAPGMIAHGKGRNFFVWWVYGVVLGPIALVHAMLLRDTRRPHFAETPRRAPSRWDSPWPLLLWAAGSFAVAIIGIAAYQIVTTGQYPLMAALNGGAMPADHGTDKEAAPAQQLSSVERAPIPSPTATPAPPPEVKVTIRRDAAPPADKRQTAQAQADASPAKPAPQADPAPDPSAKQAAAPQPPAAPKAETLERTIATSADSVPAPKAESPKLAPVRDVRVARTTPAPPSGTDERAGVAITDPKPAAHPRNAAPQPTPTPTPAKQPVAHKPAAAKPAPTDVNAVGEIVRSVQQALAARGYEPGAANGRAGHQTQQAIRKFQADRGLEPTGTIDYALLESLNIVGPRLHAFRPPPGATAGR